MTDEYEMFEKLLLDEIRMNVSDVGLDPWVLNKKNQTSFDIIDLIRHAETCDYIHNLWTRKLLSDISIYKHMNKDPKDFNIFDKIKYNIDESSGNMYINKIIKYI
jgi:hypothetical protein